MEVWLKTDALKFLVVTLVVLISAIFSGKFKFMNILTCCAQPLLLIYIVTLVLAILFGVIQYVTFQRVLGIYILFYAIPFTHGFIEGCVEDIFSD